MDAGFFVEETELAWGRLVVGGHGWFILATMSLVWASKQFQKEFRFYESVDYVVDWVLALHRTILYSSKDAICR